MSPEELYEYFKITSGVVTDTRHLINDCLFFSLKGEKFDGNEFAIEAIEKGARYAIVDNSTIAKKNKKMILVDNSLKALQELAKYHRNHINTKIIALTGSNGKTTTKELIHSVLSQKYFTKATFGNLNNHIGVPLTILKFDENTDIGIVEMGANHIGEIDFLTKITNPDFGLITNFGYAHLEGFGSFEGVIKGKSELYDFLLKNSRTAFLNFDDKLQKKWSKKLDSFTFGEDEKSDFKINYIIEKSNTLSLKFENKIIKSKIYGNYNFTNISSAIAIGKYFGLNFNQIRKGITSFLPVNNRSQIVVKGNNRITLDAYNANPTSMKASISSFCEAKHKKSVVVLGDMLELGEYSPTSHEEIIHQVMDTKVGEVLTVGNHFFETKRESKRLKKFKTIFEAEKFLSQKNYFKTNFLIKGSRSIALERLIELL